MGQQSITNSWRIVKPTGTTNFCLNPSAETTGSFAAVGAATITRSTTYQKYGLYSYRVQTGGSGDGLSLTLSALANVTHWATARIRGPIPGELRFLIGLSSKRATLLERIDDHWDLYGVAFSPAESNGVTTFGILQNGTGIFDFYIDGCQVEAQSDWTTYCDGDQEGCGWNGAEHGATSTRSAGSTAGGIPQDLYQEYRFFVQKVIGGGATAQTLTVDPYAILPGGELNSIKVESREFSLIGKFICDTEMELHDYRQELLKTLRMAKPGQPLRLQFGGARVQKEIGVFYQGGLEGDMAAFYRQFAAEEDDGWAETFKFVEKSSIQFVAPDPYWYETGESAALLDTNETDTFRLVGRRLRSTGQWDNLGPPGTPGTAVYTVVRTLAEDDTYIYIGGDFLNFDNIANADYIVRYHKQTGVYSAMSTGANGIVYSIVIGPNGDVYAGGAFTTIGGVAINRIARWDGSSWNALGTGANGIVFALVFALTGDLYAGGAFALMGGVANTVSIARWDGLVWWPLGTGMNNTVSALAAAPGGLIYAAGSFTTADGTSANRIASYDTNPNFFPWQALGSGLDNLGLALAVNPASGIVYVTGSFVTAGGVTVNYIAQWNGTSWSALGSGLNDDGRALSVGPDGTLFAGGDFTSAGGITLAARLARWNGYSWAHLDIDAAAGGGGAQVYAFLSSRFADPVVKQKYDLVIGFDGSGTAAFNGLITVDNEGNALAFPKVFYERDGTLDATIYTLRNEDTGKELLFNYALLDGERLTIDLTPARKNITSNFFGNRPGAVLANSDFGTWALEPDTQDVTSFVSVPGALYGEIVTAWMVWKDTYDSYD